LLTQNTTKNITKTLVNSEDERSQDELENYQESTASIQAEDKA